MDKLASIAQMRKWLRESGKGDFSPAAISYVVREVCGYEKVRGHYYPISAYGDLFKYDHFSKLKEKNSQINPSQRKTKEKSLFKNKDFSRNEISRQSEDDIEMPLGYLDDMEIASQECLDNDEVDYARYNQKFNFNESFTKKTSKVTNNDVLKKTEFKDLTQEEIISIIEQNYEDEEIGFYLRSTLRKGSFTPETYALYVTDDELKKKFGIETIWFEEDKVAGKVRKIVGFENSYESVYYSQWSDEIKRKISIWLIKTFMMNESFTKKTSKVSSSDLNSQSFEKGFDAIYIKKTIDLIKKYNNGRPIHYKNVYNGDIKPLVYNNEDPGNGRKCKWLLYWVEIDENDCLLNFTPEDSTYQDDWEFFMTDGYFSCKDVYSFVLKFLIVSGKIDVTKLNV